MENILTWAAPAATILAALMTASNLGSRITGAGFCVFLVGSLAWLALGWLGDDPALLWQNVVLTFLNLFGIWRWLGRQARFEEGGQHAADASQRRPGENLFPLSLTAKAPVMGRAGEELGKCIDALAGCSSGRIAYLVVAEGGLGGVGERLRRLDWSDAMVEDDIVMARIGEDEFERLELLEKDQWPGR